MITKFKQLFQKLKRKYLIATLIVLIILIIFMSDYNFFIFAKKEHLIAAYTILYIFLWTIIMIIFAYLCGEVLYPTKGKGGAPLWIIILSLFMGTTSFLITGSKEIGISPINQMIMPFVYDANSLISNPILLGDRLIRTIPIEPDNEGLAGKIFPDEMPRQSMHIKPYIIRREKS